MSRGRAFWCALGALITGALAYWLGVGSWLGQRAEAGVLDASGFNTDPPAPLGLVSTISVAIALLAVGVVALLVHGIRRALTVVVVAGVTIVASQLLKESWLERPDLFDLDAANTFPSGHMTVFVVLIGALLWALPLALRSMVALLAAVLLSVVSWQLLDYGWHRPSDILGAQALGVCAFAIAAWIGPRGSRRTSGLVGNTFARVVNLGLVILGLLILVIGVILLAFAAATRSTELLLLGGEVALTGVSALSARLLAKLAP